MILSLLKPPKRKRSRRSYLVGQLDAITSRKVRDRDGNRCRRCGRMDRVYHHHLMTKTRMATRWQEANGVTLCYFCHRWAHSAPEEFRRWVLTWMNQGEYDQLYLWSQARASFKEVDLEWMLKEARQ